MIKLEPKNPEGYMTQAQVVALKDRILSKVIYLAINDSPSNWKEISQEEGDRIIKEKREEFERNQLKNN